MTPRERSAEAAIGQLAVPGDVLLYEPRGFFGWVIAKKTYSEIGHCESYDGVGWSWASRDWIGVGRYPVRLDGLCCIMRPTRPIDVAAGRAWCRSVRGQGYDWIGLLAFSGTERQRDKPNLRQFCSEFSTNKLRVELAAALGISPFALAAHRDDPFNGRTAGAIAPCELRYTPALWPVWEEPGWQARNTRPRRDDGGPFLSALKPQ